MDEINSMLLPAKESSNEFLITNLDKISEL